MTDKRNATLRSRKVALHTLLQLLNYKATWLVFLAWIVPSFFILVARASKAVPL
ncbi:hypothetical protein [Pseudomonas sp. FME51]|uniref:hypothetical protein n=1 Tax=Pseudomonas sp. FME51 TaxID=2742609 RepID=UPI0018679164|nr:hypothetical protein [Pseudomonas sp. FME51]